jgi:hypothetical protein
VVGENHDPVSARYFAQLGAFSSEDLEPDSGEDATEPSVPPTHQPDPEKHKALQELLIQAEIVSDEPTTLLLSAPDPADVLPVKSALDGLQYKDANLFAQRLSELVYLSNVLIAGTILDGKRFEEVEAAHAVLATCNIGMSYLGEDLEEDRGGDQSVRDGLVRLFRIGWQILLQIPKHVTEQLVATLRSAEVTQKLFDRKWILAEVDATLDELVEQVDSARFGDAKTSLMFISLVVEQQTCDALQVMISDYPRYPLERQIRYVESMDDLSNIDNFLGALASHAKL